MKRYHIGNGEKHPSFGGGTMDPKELAAHRQFLEQMQMSVALANREVIHGKIPNLTADAFQHLAVMVARLRADYLEAAMRMSTTPDGLDDRCLTELKRKRELFDEGCAAFEALERAIERGYVDFGDKH